VENKAVHLRDPTTFCSKLRKTVSCFRLRREEKQPRMSEEHRRVCTAHHANQVARATARHDELDCVRLSLKQITGEALVAFQHQQQQEQQPHMLFGVNSKSAAKLLLLLQLCLPAAELLSPESSLTP